jgi:hypothetical protein
VPELDEPLPSAAAAAQGPWRSGNTNVGGQNAYISQRIPTGVSQRFNLQSGGQLVGGSTSIRVDLSNRTQVARNSGPLPIMRRPLFLGLLIAGFLSIAIAAIVLASPAPAASGRSTSTRTRAAPRFASTASSRATPPSASSAPASPSR